MSVERHQSTSPSLWIPVMWSCIGVNGGKIARLRTAWPVEGIFMNFGIVRNSPVCPNRCIVGHSEHPANRQCCRLQITRLLPIGESQLDIRDSDTLIVSCSDTLTVGWKYNCIQWCASIETPIADLLNWWRNFNSTKWCAVLKTWNFSQMTIGWKYNFIQWCASIETTIPDLLNWWRNFNSTKWCVVSKNRTLSQMTRWCEDDCSQWAPVQESIIIKTFNRICNFTWSVQFHSWWCLATTTQFQKFTKWIHFSHNKVIFRIKKKKKNWRFSSLSGFSRKCRSFHPNWYCSNPETKKLTNTEVIRQETSE
jgi:hypothetical protein